MNNKPVAIVLADKLMSKDMQVIFGEREVASLMVAGSPVIRHILLELQDIGIQQCFVLAGKNANEIYRSVNDINRWEISMQVEVLNFSITKEQALGQFRSLADPAGLLVVEADRLRGYCIERFLSRAKKSDHSLLEAFCEGVTTGITYLKPEASVLAYKAAPVELNNVMINLLGRADDFHQANFDLVAGKFSSLQPSVHRKNEQGQLHHWTSLVHKKSDTGNNVMIDKNCCVSKNSSLESVILNPNVLIEKSSILTNTIVMPDSVIPPNLRIENAIVNKDLAYQIY